MGYGARSLLGVLFVVAVIAAVVVLVAGRGDKPVARENAAGAVERFLTAAGSGDGDTACGYLSLNEQRRVEDAAGPHVDCGDAFIDARFDLASKNYLDDLGAVDFTEADHGDQATVEATNGQASRQFALVPASQTEIQEQRYQPPSTNWRIDEGATAVVRRVP